MDKEKRTKSILTGKNNLEHLYTFENFPVYMGCTEKPKNKDITADMSFSICPETGIIQLDELLPLDIVYLEQHNDGTGDLWEQHYKEFSEFLNKFKPKNVLEIGAANGRIAQIYTDKNDIKWTIIEPNPIFEGNKKIKVIKGWFDAKFSKIKDWDAIVHTHVLEHIYDPTKYLNDIHQKLNEDDLHIFSVPNMKEQLTRKYTNCLNFEHTLFLTEKVLDLLMKRHGFEVIKKYYFEDHSIFYATKKTKKIPEAAMPNEYNENKALFETFIKYHLDLVEDLNNKINNFKGNLYLFGAHIFSQYLLEFGLEEVKFKSILDNSGIKQGKRLYGTNLFVDSPEVIEKEVQPGVVLKAGAYREEIIEQLVKLNAKVEILE